MYESKNSSWVILTIYFCWTIWFIWYNAPEHPDPIKQYEEQIGYQYESTNDLLGDTVDELLEWNFNEPLSDVDEDYLFHLLRDFSSIKDLFFGRYDYHFKVHPVYPEWQTRMEAIYNYLVIYGNERTLTYEEVTDLYQALKANLYIAMDFNDYIISDQDFYDAMHNEQHEMVEVVKRRLATTY